MADDDLAGVAVVVVSYGDPALLLDNPLLLDPGVDVVVVDNWSTAAARAGVRELAARYGWGLLEPDTNLGFGAGVDLGAAHAARTGHDVALVVNPDAALPRADAATLVHHVRPRPAVLAAPRVVRPDGSPWFTGASLDLRAGRTVNRPAPPGVPWLTGACLCFRLDAWQELGGFDERFFLYWEDVELSYRWVRSGGALELVDEATCVHQVGGTQGGGRAKSRAYYYYNCRNRLLFAATHLDRRGRLRWAVRAPAYAWRVLMRGGRRQLLHPGPTLGAAARGTGTGLLELVRTFTRAAQPLG